ncbi:MAG: hypothetical protein JSV54_05465 [Chloroflexota bacterium]|nr:MAG: hypothetical protein JSV54_05465 [Chloroflexota bacterium]
MKDNPNRRKAIIWGIVTAIFVIFTPYIFGIGSYIVIPLLIIIIPIAGTTVTIYYVLQARLLNRILKGDNLLAHWTYSREEWDRYTETDYRVANKANRVWYYSFSAAALICGILFVVFKHESVGSLFVILFCMFTPVPLVMWFSTWNNHRRNRKYLGEAYITRDAVYLNRRLKTWRGTGRRLDGVVLADNESQQLLVINYSDPYRDGRVEHTVRVPVPRGQEKAAEEIAEKLNLMK